MAAIALLAKPVAAIAVPVTPWPSTDPDASRFFRAPSPMYSRWVCGDTGGLAGMALYYGSEESTTDGFPLFVSPGNRVDWPLDYTLLDGTNRTAVAYVLEMSESWRAEDLPATGYAFDGDDMCRSVRTTWDNPAGTYTNGGVSSDQDPGAVAPNDGTDVSVFFPTYDGRGDWLPTDGTHQEGYQILVLRRSAPASDTIATLWQFYGYAGRNGCFAASVTSWTADPAHIHGTLQGWASSPMRYYLTDAGGTGLNPAGVESVRQQYEFRAGWSDATATVAAIETWAAAQPYEGISVAPVQGTQVGLEEDEEAATNTWYGRIFAKIQEIPALTSSWWDSIKGLVFFFDQLGDLGS